MEGVDKRVRFGPLTRKGLLETAKHAGKDKITGLESKMAYEMELSYLEARLRRGNIFGVFYLDLDNLKVTNDTLGHDTGDRLLKKIGEGIKKSLRQTDRAYRVGGDEFIIIADEDKQRQAEQKIRDRLTKNLVDIQASMGFANTLEGKTVVETVKLAEGRMRENKIQRKQNGR